LYRAIIFIVDYPITLFASTLAVAAFTHSDTPTVGAYIAGIVAHLPRIGLSGFFVLVGEEVVILKFGHALILNSFFVPVVQRRWLRVTV
jgi:hypothetical protein